MSNQLFVSGIPMVGPIISKAWIIETSNVIYTYKFINGFCLLDLNRSKLVPLYILIYILAKFYSNKELILYNPILNMSLHLLPHLITQMVQPSEIFSIGGKEKKHMWECWFCEDIKVLNERIRFYLTHAIKPWARDLEVDLLFLWFFFAET